MKRNDWLVALMVVFIGLGSSIVADNKEKVLSPLEKPKAVSFAGVRITPGPITLEKDGSVKAVLCLENPSKKTVNLELPIEIYEIPLTSRMTRSPSPPVIMTSKSKSYKVQVEPCKKNEFGLTIYDKSGASEDNKNTTDPTKDKFDSTLDKFNELQNGPVQLVGVKILLKAAKNRDITLGHFAISRTASTQAKKGSK